MHNFPRILENNAYSEIYPSTVCHIVLQETNSEQLHSSKLKLIMKVKIKHFTNSK